MEDTPHKPFSNEFFRVIFTVLKIHHKPVVFGLAVSIKAADYYVEKGFFVKIGTDEEGRPQYILSDFAKEHQDDIMTLFEL